MSVDMSKLPELMDRQAYEDLQKHARMLRYTNEQMNQFLRDRDLWNDFVAWIHKLQPPVT